MKLLSGKHQAWLKIVHLFAASSWIGGVFALMGLHMLRFTSNEASADLYGIDQAAHLIDMLVVVSFGACLCFLTGLIYSAFTGWGFFKHKWVLIKWLLTIYGIAFGTFALGPWELNMLALSQSLGNSALTNGDYSLYRWLNLVFGLVQFLILLTMVWISVVKPWKPIKKVA